MNKPFHFTFSNIGNQFKACLEADYKIVTCEQFVSMKRTGLPEKVIVNRVDIDLSVKKADRLVEIFNKLGIKATFFLRLHATEYNPFSFENYRIIKNIIETGHEIGYHSEIIDQSLIWNEDAAKCLKRDITIINKIFNLNIKGVASHGGMTGLNNLDFWKDNKAVDFGLLYETYDSQPDFDLFNNSFYISDSEWVRWKCYNMGKFVQGDNRSIAEHLIDEHPLIYILIHPETYFDRHFYE